ncbi:MAG: N-acetyl-gamma-glutamyl-phosphate reductase [Polyangiaceae bacterium]|nr:N-acetyl-gamma-glutamyl-phosphate reductase [Polyangiaceae bacterium]
MSKLRVGIIGAAGYTGAELIRLIDAHPYLELKFVAARENAGQRLDQVIRSTQGVDGLGELMLERFEEGDALQIGKKIDVAFTALPHAASARLGGALLDAGVQVVDLSADFRLKDQALYEQWYGQHPRPELIPQAVYGLPELYRSKLQGAQLIAGPGCYPTSAILPLAPLIKGDLIELDQPLIVDGKSGLSGAGRKPAQGTLFAESGESMRAYKVAGQHRHTPEMEQELSVLGSQDWKVLFTPQLAPMIRGILTTTYARVKAGVSAAQCREAARDLLQGPLISILPEDTLPDTLHVRGSGRAQIAYAIDDRTGLVLSIAAIDNLARGASSQALAAFNISRDYEEATGIPRLAQYP